MNRFNGFNKSQDNSQSNCAQIQSYDLFYGISFI